MMLFSQTPQNKEEELLNATSSLSNQPSLPASQTSMQVCLNPCHLKQLLF